MNYDRSMEAASIALATGDDAAAERALRAAIESADHTERELVTALVKLGTLKQTTGAHSEAEPLFRKALEIGEKTFGADDLDLVPVLSGLGAARIQSGAPGDAERLLSRALEISESSLGPDHPDLVILLNDLSRLYLNRSAPEAAEPLLNRLLVLKKIKGEDHPEVATVLASLAGVQQALGRHEAAEHLWRRVLGIRERTLAPNHFALATALEHLAETCSARGKVHEALQFNNRALAIRELTLGREHASVRVARERIADLRLQESDRAEASTAVVLPTGGHAKAPREPVQASLVALIAPPALAVANIPKNTHDYLEVLNRIKNELDAPRPEDEAQPKGVWSWLARVGERLRKPRNAAIVGSIIIMLPIAAFAAVRATRSGEATLRASQATASDLRSPSDTPMVHPLSNSTESSSDPLGVSTTLAGHAIPSSGGSGTAGREDDARARRSSGSGSRGGERPEPEREATNEGGGSKSEPPPSMWTPNMSQLASIRLDSAVRAAGVAARGTPGESIPTQFRSLLDSTDLVGPASGGISLRARLIGSMPSPRYPAQLLVGGRRVSATDVRVRVDVDVTGRPVMSTFTVLGSPDSLFVDAVKEIIPVMRFEPARSPWPASRPMVDRVELSFRFAPRVK